MTGVEQLKQYKEMLDAGIITQEEFDIQKKRILGEYNIVGANKEMPKTVSPKKSKLWIVFLVAAAFICIGILCFAFIFLKKSPKNKKEKANETSTGITLFNDGLLSYKDGDYWGFLDKDGDTVINAQYEDVFEFSEGLAAVKLDEKWGFIDKNGDTVIKPQFDYVSYFRDGISLVEKNDLYGVIDNEGNYLINPKYDAIEVLGDNLFLVNERDKDYSLLVDKNDESISNTQFGKIIYSFFDYDNEGTVDNELKPVCLKNDKYCYINKKGEIVLKTDYTSAGRFVDGLARVGKKYGKDEKKTLYGFIDKKGKEVISPQYTSAYSFSEGLASVKIEKDGKEVSGYIDIEGDEVIGMQYSYAGSFKSGYAVVILKKGSEVIDLLIDKEGNEVIDSSEKYDSVDYYDKLDICVVSKDGDYSIIKTNGEILLDESFKRVTVYDDGYAIVLNEDKEWNVINLEGNEVFDEKFDAFHGMSSELCVIDGCYNYVSSSSEKGYCYTHYKELEKKKTTGELSLIGTWKTSGGDSSMTISFYSSGNMYVSFSDGDSYTGEWKNSSIDVDNMYLTDISGLQGSVFIHRDSSGDYMYFYTSLDSEDPVTLYKQV